MESKVLDGIPSDKLMSDTTFQPMPCPFCGEMPNILQVRDPRYGKFAYSWVVECKQMGCIFSRSSPNQSFDALLEQWNTRAGGYWIYLRRVSAEDD